MEDIAPDLRKRIQGDFEKGYKQSNVLKKFFELGSKATYEDANEASIEIGKILAQAYKRNLSSDVLPDGKMYYNIANTILTPTMTNGYDVVSDIASQVQTYLNEAAGIGIKAIKPELNKDRINGLINKISNADVFDDVAWVLGEPIVNFTQSIIDDSIRENVEFHGKSGMQPKIVRKLAGNCCDWCKEVAGTYTYPDVPKDVYRRHQRCRCTVEYDPGSGKKQNVWTKSWKNTENSDKIKALEKAESQKEEIRKLFKLSNLNQISIPPKEIDADSLLFDEEHVKESKHNVTREDAVSYIKNAKMSIDVWNGDFTRFFSNEGASYVNNKSKTIRTSFSNEQYTINVKEALEVLKNE